MTEASFEQKMFAKSLMCALLAAPDDNAKYEAILDHISQYEVCRNAQIEAQKAQVVELINLNRL